jgi:hypothetical protein
MAPAARASSHEYWEYWRPNNPEVVRVVEGSAPDTACWRCGIEYSRGARFCHICGSDRDPRAQAARKETPQPHTAELLELKTLRQRLGLSVPCLVFFLLGITCMIGAALTGFVYKAETLVDWQAVQTWRIEWFLGATASMLAGILLKKSDC